VLALVVPMQLDQAEREAAQTGAQRRKLSRRRRAERPRSMLSV
jgi:hypothetical protein